MVLLGWRELEAGDDSPRLGDVVAVDRGLEPLPQRLRLTQLAAQPAEQADLGRSLRLLQAHDRILARGDTLRTGPHRLVA